MRLRLRLLGVRSCSWRRRLAAALMVSLALAACLRLGGLRLPRRHTGREAGPAPVLALPTPRPASHALAPRPRSRSRLPYGDVKVAWRGDGLAGLGLDDVRLLGRNSSFRRVLAGNFAHATGPRYHCLRVSASILMLASPATVQQNAHPAARRPHILCVRGRVACCGAPEHLL